jgi:septal ring factor EnvC (AmiA/AmiB activator)
MDMFTIVLTSLLGLAVGVAVTWPLALRFSARRINDLAARLAEAEARCTEATQRVDTLGAELQQERLDHATTKAAAERIPELQQKLDESLATVNPTVGDRRRSVWR